ncbi:MAG: beta-ketoacyl synthase, partial [Candidatus Zixiibacteriota bacterium]
VVMTNYFDTMRRFLETQEHIMSLYLDGSTTKRSSGARFQRLVQSQSKTMAASPELEGLQATQQPAPMAQSTEVVRQVDEDTPVQSGAAPVVPHPSDVPPNPVSIDADSQGAVVDREKMTDMFFTIIEDKTGYPRDMVGLDQNLEADLGIDSIKRIEVVGAILQTLPESYGKALGEDRTSLNTLATLNDMLDMLGELKVDEGETPPFDQAGVGSGTSIASYLPRHILEAKLEPLEKTTQTRLEQGHFLITEDTIGVAEALSAVLCEQGCTVSLLEREVLQDEASLHKWCASLNRNGDGIAGIIHLAQLGSAWLQLDAPLADWRNQIQLNEKSLFILLNHFSSELHDDAHILSASGLGGYFNHQPDKASGLSLQGGFVGLLKSLFEERSSLRVKAVDIDLAQQTSSIVEVLLSELEVAGGRQEIGYPDGNRIIFQTISKSIDESEENLEAIRDIVILATGGLRGITAEVLRELALPGNTLLLTGRSALSEHEPEELQALTTSEDLQKYFINQMRDGSQKLTPADIQRKVKSTFAAREMRNNLEEFRSTGAIVEYYPVDVTDEDAMAQLFDNIYKKHGTINGVIHGAGVIEDKLLADKTGESWSRVVETKVIGLLLLQKYINSESLRFFTVFSSVAGRYGNSGQTDYATANELMNRLCCQLKMNWPDHVKVRSFCWGPWGQTKFGAGMVTAETEAKFAEKGVTLVSADIGSRLFKTELTREANSHVEIICGAGPWEQHEAAIGQFDKKPQTNTAALSPLLDNASLSTSPKGNQVITFSLTDNHAYLQEHCIDNVPVLPAAVALEIMVEAATSLWPGWLVIEAHDFRLMKGIELKSKEQEFKLTINPPPYGSSSGFEISCTLQSELETGNKQVHYRSVLRLEQQFPQTSVHEPQSYTDKQLTVAKAYNEWLFHGPRFQVIEEIDGLSDSGAKALVRTSRPGEWMGNIGPCNDQWDFEPGLIDAAAQMALLWARVFRNESALPVRFGRVVRYFDILPEKLYMNFNRIITDESHL